MDGTREELRQFDELLTNCIVSSILKRIKQRLSKIQGEEHEIEISETLGSASTSEYGRFTPIGEDMDLIEYNSCFPEIQLSETDFYAYSWDTKDESLLLPFEIFEIN